LAQGDEASGAALRRGLRIAVRPRLSGGCRTWSGHQTRGTADALAPHGSRDRREPAWRRLREPTGADADNDDHDPFGAECAPIQRRDVESGPSSKRDCIHRDPLPVKRSVPGQCRRSGRDLDGERFIQSINAGDFNGAATLVAQDAGVSDCDYIHRTVALFNGKPSVMQWLAARIAEHDQFAIGSIFNENDVFTPVVGVEFANRANDTLTRLGSPSRVVPAEVAKVVLTPDMTQIRGFLFGPGGADPRTIAEVCGPA
jgi:hypothetical protein